MRLLLALTLAFGAFMGVPMDPEKVREVLELSSRTQQTEVVRKRSDGDEDIEAYLKRRGLRSR